MANPTDSSPSPWLRVVAAVGGVLLIAGAIVLSNQAPAAAMGLERFGSCGELRDHLVDAAIAEQRAWGAEVGVAVEDAASGAPTSAAESDGAGQAMSGDDGTNTQVAGVDELDVVEALPDGRSLVVRRSSVLLVSVDGREVLDRLSAPPEARITFDEDRGVLWAVGGDWQATQLLRARLAGDAFAEPEQWSVQGRLVDLRRAGATVHLVAVDADVQPIEPGIATGPAEDAVPFAGTSPVPCDEVLHTSLPGGPATTLVARFTADGPLAPTAATEVVGAGDNVLVTDTAVYVSTPVVDGSDAVTGIHRFDADDLGLTGSGRVAGRLLNQFSLDEHDGHLRVAVTHGGGGFGMPMPVDVDVLGGDVAVEAQAVEATPVTSIEPMPPTTDPEPTTTTVEDPATTTTDAPTSTTSEPPTPSTTEAPTTTTEPTTTTTTVEEPITPLPPQPDALNEVVVLDLDGSLDEVGRSVRFGHPGETIHGIRFAGGVAYAVTFLQTDPFYVIDLSDPAAPAVLGELEIPGFSAYLHPISATEVVGFGPGPDGNVLARLFDVSNPAAPAVVDTVAIGDDSPIAYDHHALRTSGGRMLLPATDYVALPRTDCPPEVQAQERLDDLYRRLDEAYGRNQAVTEAELRDLEREIGDVERCAYPTMAPRGRIVTLAPGEGQLRPSSLVTDAGEAHRVIALADGGYLLVGTEVVRVSASGTVEAELA